MSFFNQIKIRTPESVELEFRLAGIGSRTVALIIDYLIWGTALIGLLLIWTIVLWQLQEFFPTNRNIGLWLTAISLLISFAVYCCYFIVFETLWQGQTPGKRYANIRVVRDDGQPVGLSQTLLRSLLRPIDDILLLGVCFIIFGKQEKRIGDWVAGTLVIQEEQAIASAQFPLSKESEVLATKLLAEANVGALVPDDFAVIRAYLQRRSLMDARAKAELGRQLADQLSGLIGISALPFELPPDVFLEAVYCAYQQQMH